MTKEEYLKGKGMFCPNCKGTEFLGEEFEQEKDLSLSQEIYCKKCGCVWEDMYTLTDIKILNKGKKQ